MTITKKLSFLTVLLVTFLAAIRIWSGLGTMEEAKKYIENTKTNIEGFVAKSFPKDLQIKLEAGKVILNKKTPYCLMVDEKENMGVIFDNSTTLDPKSFDEKPENFPCKPIVVIGSDYMMVREKEAEIRVYQVPKNFNVTIDQKMLLDNSAKYLPLFQKWGWVFYLMLPLLLLVVILPLIMLFNYWYSWILQLAAKIFKLSESPELANKYWITLFFGAILSAIHLMIGTFFGWQLSFPFLTTILVTTAGIVYLKKKSSRI